MRRITSKIIFLAGVLIQGISTVRADQPSQRGWVNITNPSPSLSSGLKGAKLLNETDRSIALESNVSLQKSTSSNWLKAKTYLKKRLPKLNLPANLQLPKKPSQVQVGELQPITIDEVERLVMENSPKLKASAIKVDQKKSLLLGAISAWYPNINLSANGLPQYLEAESFRNPDFKTTSSSYSNSKQWSASFSIQVKWNLIDPARVPEIAASRDAFEKAKASYLVDARDSRLRALKEYFFLQRADEGVRIGTQSVRASLMSLRDAKARYEAGLSTRLEVLEAETQLARDKQLLTQKLGDQKIARRSLAQILNLSPKITPTASSPAQVMGTWTASLQESIIAAYDFREELDAALLNISINNNDANSALALGQPTLSIFNTLTTSRFQGQTAIASPTKVDMDDYGWTVSNAVGLTANWNIFDGGKSKSLYLYNKQKAKESKANLTSIKNQIRLEVENSFYTLKTANQDIATTTREVLASRESLRLARLRFNAGVAPQREVVNTQRDLTQAEVRYSNAITTYNTSLAELRRRTGIDHVKACKPTNKNISSKKEKVDELFDIPIEPSPLIPACQASTIRNKG